MFVRSGTLTVRAWQGDKTTVVELNAQDAAYIPRGASHEYRNYGSATVEAIFGVAPSYLDATTDPLP